MIQEKKDFSYLETYAHVMGGSEYDAIDREDTIDILDATVNRPRMKNICLVAEPGMGKTQVVDTWAKRRKEEFITYEVDVEAMGGKGPYTFGENLKQLIAEIEDINATQEEKVVMFIDEVHVLGRPEYSIALEALKPAMTKGKIRFIGATTDEEYMEYIEGNAALTDRFEKLNLPEVSRETIMKILITMWQKELPEEQVDEDLLNTIIDYGIYMPSKSQPRKSIKILDDLIGWYNTKNVVLNEALLDKRIMSTTGVNPKFKVDITRLEETMKRRVKGQDFAIDTLIDSLHVSVAGLSDPTRPMGSFIFLGPTGVGKTEIAKSAAEGLFGDEDKLARFDMSEFQLKDDVVKFNHKLAEKAQKRPFSLFLFDEIEKSHRGVMDLLLQILDDARLNNRYGRQVTFRNAYIIMTTNIGHEDFENARTTGQDMTENLSIVKNVLTRQTAFRPELVNRCDALVPFSALERDVRNIIVESGLERLKNDLKEMDIDFDYNPLVITFLTREVSDEETTSGGGRDLNRKIFDYVKVLLAKTINTYGKYEIQTINIGVFGKMMVQNKKQKETKAKLGITLLKTKSRDGVIDIYKGNVDKGVTATGEQAEHYREEENPNQFDYNNIFEEQALF